jgi:CBS domain-containing protein
MSVGRICVREVCIARPDETACAGAERMRDQCVGCLIVVDEDSEPVGIVTDRDLAVRVLAAGHDGAKVTLGEVMTPGPRVVDQEASIEDSVALMRRAGIRRLPVVDSVGALAGLVTLDDVLDLLSEELGDIGRLLTLQGPDRPEPPEVVD